MQFKKLYGKVRSIHHCAQIRSVNASSRVGLNRMNDEHFFVIATSTSSVALVVYGCINVHIPTPHISCVFNLHNAVYIESVRTHCPFGCAANSDTHSFNQRT